MSDERIGRSFQERKATGDYKERNQEKCVTPNDCRGPEQECSGSKERKTDDESGFVSESPHDQAGRNCEYEISGIKGGLNQSRLEPVNFERLHELADQNVVEIVWDAPEEEQGSNQEKWQEVAAREERGLLSLRCRR